MLGGDEVIFTGTYKEFSLGIRFDLNEKKAEDVGGALAYLSSVIEPYAYKFSGIDTKKIEDFVKLDGKGVSAACSFLENKSTEWNKLVKETVKKPELKSAADSYLFNRLLSAANVKFKVSTATLEPEKEEIGKQIAFIGKYKDWVSIKKLSMEKVQDYEVSGILSGINFSVVNKAFDFSGMGKDDATVNNLTKGKKKSLGNALLVLKELEGKNPYIICKSLEAVGYRPYASSHMLTGAYPDIKPPKVKGRKPKG
ncbi:DUF2666 family protein [Candidatus Micrarchaeota archaeon]|nr:DUF2666 family protein [Candidatus Micrarchaeota archaeon]